MTKMHENFPEGFEHGEVIQAIGEVTDQDGKTYQMQFVVQSQKDKWVEEGEVKHFKTVKNGKAE